MVYLLLHSNDVGYIFTQIVRGGGGCGLASLQRGFPKMQFHILRILAVDWRYEGSEYY